MGAIVGPIVIGFLLGLALPHKINFLAVAIPAIIAVIAVALIRPVKVEEETIIAANHVEPIKQTS